MKYLKNISLFKIALFLTLNIFINKPLLIFITLVYFLINNKKEGFLFICLFMLMTLCNNYRFNFLSLGIVEEKYTNYVVIDKLLYKEILYEDKQIGDFVLTKTTTKIEDEKLLKYNSLFYVEETKGLCNFKLRNIINERFNLFDVDTKANLKKILLNKYSDEGDVAYLGDGFAFYYLLLYFLRNKRLVCILLLSLYIILFGFDIKFYLIIIELIIDKHFKGFQKIGIKLIIICFINKYLLLNNSILLSLIFSYFYNSEFKSDKSIILAIQSLFFYETNILSIFIYKYLIMMRIFLFSLSIIVFILPVFSSGYLIIIEFISRLYSLFTISLRGQIPLFILIIIYLLFNILKIKSFLRILFIIFILILPLHQISPHLSFVDVGQGDATLLSIGFKNVLIVTGSTYNYQMLRKELYRKGIYKLEYLIISHSDEDHSGNIDALKKDFKINKIVYDGEDINFDNSYLYCLNVGNFDNDNDNSLIYLYDDGNIRVLFPGDISKEVELILLEKYELKDIDIIHTAHHGSNTSSDEYFIGSINPKAAIISTNGKYNHPHIDTLTTLDKYQVETFITKEESTIHLYHCFDKYFVSGKTKIMVFD